MDEEQAKENVVVAGSPVSYEPEAKKPRIGSSDVEEIVDLTSIPEDAPKTPKHRTPKISKEAREAERLKKLELKRQKEEEKEKLRAERERIAEEKRKEKERIEEEKRKEREKKEKEREEKRKEEERRKEEKRKADEERQERLRKEEEERQKKKDEREQKRREEEERKEMKRREDEAAEEKKRRASERFVNFFSKGEKKPVPKSSVAVEETDELWYLPFQVKPGMTIAPIHFRPVLQPDDDILTPNDQVTASTYLSSEAVKHRKIVGCRKIPQKTKLFQFHDNYRPPYYGTWRKRDAKINPRRPCSADSEDLDYQADSDAEWEDEPSDAEECRSDEEDDGPDSEEEDSESGGGFLVEPEYLSDGEGEDADDERASESAEGRAQRLAQRASDWKRRVLDRPKLLQPACVGPLYDGTALATWAAAATAASSATVSSSTSSATVATVAPTTCRAAATLAAHQAVALP